jgi:acyl-CoA reductase-like NAD-dependent aldehyde dehydrogenase
MRASVLKTYKLYIGGQFPRSESGRSYRPAGAPAINVARGSRKDLRDAVVAGRKALSGWSERSGYNRGQILYRLAEMLETRKASLGDEIRACTDATAAVARREVEAAIDLCTWYAGLCDKLTTLLGSQNGVSGPFFNFSTVEPTGVVAAVAPQRPSLLGLLAVVLPLLAGGNTVVALCSAPAPLPGLALGELLAVSDVPAGVVNLLGGLRSELVPQMAAHRDVDGLLVAGPPDADIGRAAADSVKRVRCCDLDDGSWNDARQLASLWWVEPFVEVKTFWHPVAF